MPCELREPAAGQLWSALLGLRRFVDAAGDDRPPVVWFALDRDGAWSFHADAAFEPGEAHERLICVPLDTSATPVDAMGNAPVDAAPDISVFDYAAYRAGQPPWTHRRPAARAEGSTDPAADSLTFLRLYLPLILGPLHAREADESFVVAHVAQTLDGRIACLNGHSQWISNEANLHHAHRLRALNDAVLVGGGTVAADDPQLTVRHVEGDDPTRVVLSASGRILDDPSSYRVIADGGIVVCGRDRASTNGHGATVIPLDAKDGVISPRDVLTALRGSGIRTVFLEGGAATLSSFLETRAIDLLHVHVAPMIIGSGISSFTLPTIESVQEARRFRMEHFTLDGELLLECRGTVE